MNTSKMQLVYENKERQLRRMIQTNYFKNQTVSTIVWVLHDKIYLLGGSFFEALEKIYQEVKANGK